MKLTHLAAFAAFAMLGGVAHHAQAQGRLPSCNNPPFELAGSQFGAVSGRTVQNRGCSLGVWRPSPRVLTQAQNGTVAIESDGRVNYTPREGFVGSDSFRVRLGPAATVVVTMTVDN